MPTPTYTPLATVTVAIAATSITFSNIPATYRDLVLVANYSTPIGSSSQIQFNSDTGSNYSTVSMRGDGSSVNSALFTTSFIQPSNGTGEAGGTRNMYRLQLMDYSATDKHKTTLLRMDNAGHTQAQANRWANTAAITSIYLYNATFSIGSTFSLYGVIA